MTTFREQLSIYIATAFARQLALEEFLGKHYWSVDIDAATVDFGNGKTYPIQLLGTESESQRNWLWAWANQYNDLPDRILQACNRIRTFGKKNKIAELTDPSVPLSVANGHMLALLSAGVIGNCCYYRGPYKGGGALFFLVSTPPAPVFAPITLVRAVTTISQVVSQFDVNHRLMVEHFLDAQGFAITQSDLAI